MSSENVPVLSQILIIVTITTTITIIYQSYQLNMPAFSDAKITHLKTAPPPGLIKLVPD